MDMQTQKKCLVTGATGFVGTNLVHELVKTGWDVRASGMHGSVTKYIADLPIEIVLADITKSEEVDGIVEGCDVVFHVAGDTSFWRRHRERQAKINIDGTMN
ncbi:MAG: NAD-dependent epimerase/dehydratase family protein, partial [Chloroflexota bacterium]